MIDNDRIIEDMKERIPEHPVLKHYLEDIMEDGIDKETALDIMITAWIKRINGDVE